MKRPYHIALDSALDEPLAFEFDIPFTLDALDREPLLEISPVHLEGTVSRIEGGFALEARCAFRGKLECSRCLAAYSFETEEPFSLVLYKRAAPQSDMREMTREDFDVSYYEGDQLAVTPIAEERVQMAIPMKPLCREDCLGLCARCGTDLNLGPCECVPNTTDPRWSALQGFKGATKREKV